MRADQNDWRKRKASNLKGTTERRTFDARLELRNVRGADGAAVLRLVGYASITGVEYQVGGFTEIVLPGAFKRTLSESPDVQLLVSHGQGGQLALARTKSGTLRLSEDQRGLRVEADLDPEDPDVQSLARKMKRGDVDQMSFAFRATSDRWSEDATRREISGVSLHRGDVSVVNMGANEAATAAIRSRELTALREQIGRARRRDAQRLRELRIGHRLAGTSRRTASAPTTLAQRSLRERAALEQLRNGRR